MTMFTSNYIGIVFSAHVKSHFYTWFFHSLPFLAWTTPYIPAYFLTIIFNIELMYNTPAVPLSSFVLFGTNLLFVWLITKYYKEELDYISPLDGKRARAKSAQAMESSSANNGETTDPKSEEKPKSE